MGKSTSSQNIDSNAAASSINGAGQQQSQTASLIQNLIGGQNQKQQKEKSRFQMTAFDILFNPLRAEHPFENWSPREISKFQACFLMYGKHFGEYK